MVQLADDSKLRRIGSTLTCPSSSSPTKTCSKPELSFLPSLRAMLGLETASSLLPLRGTRATHQVRNVVQVTAAQSGSAPAAGMLHRAVSAGRFTPKHCARLLRSVFHETGHLGVGKFRHASHTEIIRTERYQEKHVGPERMRIQGAGWLRIHRTGYTARTRPCAMPCSIGIKHINATRGENGWRGGMLCLAMADCGSSRHACRGTARPE